MLGSTSVLPIEAKELRLFLRKLAKATHELGERLTRLERSSAEHDTEEDRESLLEVAETVVHLALTRPEMTASTSPILVPTPTAPSSLLSSSEIDDIFESIRT
jgi:hypothetical protein